MDLTVILAFAAALFGATLALTIGFYERRSLAHWGFVVGMLALATERAIAGMAAGSLQPADAAYWQNWRLAVCAFLPGIWLFFSLTYARGNYRESLVKWRYALGLFFLLPLALAIAFPQRLILLDQTNSGEAIRLTEAGFVISFLNLVSAILVLMNLERTFRAAVGTMRWRIKSMVLGLGVLFAVHAYVSSQVLLFRGVESPLQSINSVALLAATLLIGRSLFRAGHFDVQVYPSQAVLHSSLTLLVAGIYLVIVGVLARLVTLLGGPAAFPLKAFVVLLALILLALLLLSDRVRLYSQRFVSRHFQRPLYDYRTVWRNFTEVTARCLDQTGFCAAVTRLVSDVFQALGVTIWLLADGKDEFAFGASTSLSEAKAAQLRLEPADALVALNVLREHTGPIDLDAAKEDWAPLLRRLHPGEFRKGANRICLPMFAGGELLGCLMVGDRVGGVPFSSQDLDLLKSVSDQAAASLLNLRLSQRLSQARQLEAFQAMSAFFVHDLKNTASTLSLMLQNLPTHFNDPQFREDALRGISKTVTHINDLISRLSLLRRELTVQPVESDLNEVVVQALKSFGSLPPHIEIIKQLGALPKVHFDPVQIQNVVTNLVLNACEAIGAAGRINLQSSRRNGWAVLVVADNGCGMSPEFLQRSLFRPFQTTKKKGIGIGMFQCKMIVEAHRGRIEVESQPGKGTTFRMLLPLAGNAPQG